MSKGYPQPERCRDVVRVINFSYQCWVESESLALLKRRAQEISARIEAMRAEMAPLEVELEQVKRGIAAMVGAYSPTRAETSRVGATQFVRKPSPEAQALTIKQMVITILREHLPSGATANELLDAFMRIWGRNEMRTSLSPQLTRLKREGKIELYGRVWHLSRNEIGEAEASPEVSPSDVRTVAEGLDQPIAPPASTS